MTSLGDGGLNMPYEDDPLAGTRYETQLPMSESAISSGVVLTAGVISGHGIEALDDPHPIVQFRFVRPDGHFYKTVSLVITENELLDLKRLVSDTIDGARKAARKRRKKKGGGAP